MGQVDMFCPLIGGNDRTLHSSAKIVKLGSKNNETLDKHK